MGEASPLFRLRKESVMEERAKKACMRDFS